MSDDQDQEYEVDVRYEGHLIDELADVIESVGAKHPNTGGKIYDSVDIERVIECFIVNFDVHKDEADQAVAYVHDKDKLDDFATNCRVKAYTSNTDHIIAMRTKSPHFKALLHAIVHYVYGADLDCDTADQHAKVINKRVYEARDMRRVEMLKHRCKKYRLPHQGSRLALEGRLRKHFIELCKARTFAEKELQPMTLDELEDMAFEDKSEGEQDDAADAEERQEEGVEPIEQPHEPMDAESNPVDVADDRAADESAPKKRRTALPKPHPRKASGAKPSKELAPNPAAEADSSRFPRDLTATLSAFMDEVKTQLDALRNEMSTLASEKRAREDAPMTRAAVAAPPTAPPPPSYFTHAPHPQPAPYSITYHWGPPSTLSAPPLFASPQYGAAPPSAPAPAPAPAPLPSQNFSL